MTTPPAVEIESLSYTYPDGQAALHAVNLRVAPGERIALVGPNGAGKSTLLLHLNGILQGQGSLRICGLTVEKSHLGRIRALVGLVFQAPDDQLFSPTVYEDVAYGPIYMGLPPEEIDRRVQTALVAVGLPGYAHRSPARLSLGEKKRIAIASVLSMQPEILVFDEPTAGMDPRARRSLIELLAGLPQTLLVASHDLALVRELLPRTLVLDEGRVVADGPTAQVLANPDFLQLHGLC